MNGLSVQARNLGKSYRTGAQAVEVLAGVDFEMAGGDAAVVTGPSGSGKSTLLHILGSLEEPTTGEVRIGDRPVSSMGEHERAAFRNRDIGFVFQDHHLLPQFDVFQNVLLPTLPRKLTGGERASVEERARGLLRTVGLEERVDHRPTELSGGERQRAAIARALINEPGLLLCDEPTGNLDAANGSRIGDLLLDVQEAEGVTLVVVTHSQELAGRFSRAFVLREGTLAPAGSA